MSFLSADRAKRLHLLEAAVWEFVLAPTNMGDGDADPSSIRPRPELLQVTGSFNGLVRTEFITAKGKPLLGWIMPCTSKTVDGFCWQWRCQPEVFSSRGRVALNVPNLSLPSRRAVRRKVLDTLLARLGMPADTVFPRVVLPAVPIKGLPKAWVFTGFVQPDGNTTL